MATKAENRLPNQKKLLKNKIEIRASVDKVKWFDIEEQRKKMWGTGQYLINSESQVNAGKYTMNQYHLLS